MSQHGADRFNGYAVGEEHRRGCRVTALMPCNMLGDTATLGDGTDSGKARVIMTEILILRELNFTTN